jgi:hypothetical protein
MRRMYCQYCQLDAGRVDTAESANTVSLAASTDDNEHEHYR